MFNVGNIYKFSGDTVDPSFEMDCSDIGLYANDGFIMRHGNIEVKYKHGIIRPAYQSMCECISVDPLTFEVDKIESPLIEEDVKRRQYKVIEQTLTYLVLGTSDTEIQAIAKVAIPWSRANDNITVDLVINTLIGYFDDNVGRLYQGSNLGYQYHKQTLQSALTVIFGHRIANAIMTLDNDKVRVKYEDPGVFVAYYDGTEMGEFLDSIERNLDGGSKEPSSFFRAAAMMGQ